MGQNFRAGSNYSCIVLYCIAVVRPCNDFLMLWLVRNCAIYYHYRICNRIQLGRMVSDPTPVIALDSSQLES